VERESEDAFPYIETPDQLAAIDEIKRDMESAPMDRLICGDVGYGIDRYAYPGDAILAE